MRRTMTALVIAVSALANPSAWAADGSRRVIVTFDAASYAQNGQAVLQGLNAQAVDTISAVGTKTNKDFVAVVADLPAAAAAPAGRVVEDDYRVKWIEAAPASFQAAPFQAGASLGALGLQRFSSVSSPAFRSWFSAAARRNESPWGVERVHASAAWPVTQGADRKSGLGVRVAVIDTGIDYKHADLQGKVDGGYNAIVDSEDPRQYKDDNGHGTHVAGTIAAAKDGQGVVGVAPKARLYSIKVLDAGGSGSLSDVIKGLIWCADHDIQVANMSLGSQIPSEALHRALMYAKARGVVVVAAAGNVPNGPVGYPGAYPEAIAVAASGWQNDNFAPWSSSGPQVRFIAPGMDIMSDQLDGDVVPMGGTSMAAPHVAGLAALVVSLGYRGLDGPDGVLMQLEKAASRLPNLSPAQQGLGMIDAGKLVR